MPNFLHWFIEYSNCFILDDGAPRTGISAQSDDAVDPDGYLINVTGSGITIFDDQVNYLLVSNNDILLP